MKCFILLILFMVSMPQCIFADTPDFNDDFEAGTNHWAKHGSEIALYERCGSEENSCVRIWRYNPWGYTFISRSFRVPSKGSLRIEGQVFSCDIVPGNKQYERGKFIAVLISHGKEIGYLDADFDGNSKEWIPRSIYVPRLDPSIDVDLRIGLQNATGCVYVDNVKVFFIPDD